MLNVGVPSNPKLRHCFSFQTCEVFLVLGVEGVTSL